MAPEMPAAQTSPKSDKLSSVTVFGSYLRFQGNQWIPQLGIILWHTTWTPNLYYLESRRGRYGASKEGLRIRKIWTSLSLWKPSWLLSQGISRGRQGGACPKNPQKHKYNHLGAQGEVTMEFQPFYRRHSPEPPQDDGESWMSSSQGSIPVDKRKQEEDSKPLA
jgi:hypothetical protein